MRAIRRTYQSPSGYGGVVAFQVAAIRGFAKRLVEQSVREELMRLERNYLGSATSRDSAAGARLLGFMLDYAPLYSLRCQGLPQ